MKLKRKISKDEFEKLSEELQGIYSEEGDSYMLTLEGDEDAGALKRAKDREKELRREAETKLAEMENRLSEIEGDDARKKGDIQTLEKSWQKKIEETETKYKGELENLQSFAKSQLVDSVASSLASELSTSPRLLMPHIKSRLQADFEGDKPATRILDKDGKPSALSIEDLKNEFLTDKDFSSILIASKASGGAGGEKKAQGFGESGGEKPKDLSSLNPKEMAAYLEAKHQSQE